MKCSNSRPIYFPYKFSSESNKRYLNKGKKTGFNGIKYQEEKCHDKVFVLENFVDLGFFDEIFFDKAYFLLIFFSEYFYLLFVCASIKFFFY